MSGDNQHFIPQQYLKGFKIQVWVAASLGQDAFFEYPDFVILHGSLERFCRLTRANAPGCKAFPNHTCVGRPELAELARKCGYPESMHVVYLGKARPGVGSDSYHLG